MINRRELLKLGAGQLLLAASNFELAQAQPLSSQKRLSICQLATDSTSTILRVIHDKQQTLDFSVAGPGAAEVVIETEIFTTSHYDALTLVYVDGLNLEHAYQFTVMHHQQIIDRRNFAAFDSSRQSYRFILGSCMNEITLNRQIWQQMPKQDADFMLFVGDTVYADLDANWLRTPDYLFRRFCQALKVLPYGHWENLLPIFATWDDHDFGANNSGIDYPFIAESQANFKRFFAIDSRHDNFVSHGPGVAKALKFGDCVFSLMDCRSFRQKKKSKLRFAHWGEEQEGWFYDLLAQHAGPTWLLSGSQMFPGTRLSESLSFDHQHNFAEFKKELQKSKGRCLFASGDVHFSELSKIDPTELGYESREITASSIHSSAIPGLHLLLGNRRRISASSQHNFLLIEMSSKSGNLDINYSCIDENGRSRFAKDFSLLL